MAEKEIVLTAEDFNELKEKLEYMKTVIRKEVAEKIKQARSFGDLSENAEYDEARAEQAEVEAKISEIEYSIKHAKVIDASEINLDVVGIGTKVKFLDLEFDEELEYLIVGAIEGDPSGKLSYESPVGAALMHHAAGETVTANTPDGAAQFKILEITK